MADSEAQIKLSEISGFADMIANFWCSYECGDGDWDVHAKDIIEELTKLLETNGVKVPEYCRDCAYKQGEYMECDGTCSEEDNEEE